MVSRTILNDVGGQYVKEICSNLHFDALRVSCRRSDDQTATVIPQPETKQTQNNKNQEITVTVYRAPVNGEEYLLPEKVTRKAGADDCSGELRWIFW